MTGLRGRLGAFVRGRRRERRIARWKGEIARSGLFDAAWYRTRYGHLVSPADDPLDHFVRAGGARGFSPSSAFDTTFYVRSNADVRTLNVNPLVHYLEYGQEEGRLPRSPAFREPTGPDPELTISVLLHEAGGGDAARTRRSLDAGIWRGFEVVPFRGFDRAQDAGSSPAAGAPGFRAAVRAATGTLLVVLDAGDELVPEALGEMAELLARTGFDVGYGDERASPDGPVQLKPSWSPDTLRACNYLGRLTALRRSLVVAALDAPGVRCRTEWELNLLCTERTPRIERCPRVLCTRAAGRPGGRAPDDLDRQVLVDHLGRIGLQATVTVGPHGLLRATWPLSGRPRVSVVIPNRDRPHLISTCLAGLLTGTAGPELEIVVVDNGSTDPETLAIYGREAARLRIVPFDEEFNYSRACNLGAAAATGDLLLFLNNDIEITDPDWLAALVRTVQLPGVGVAGPKLLYPDGAIQHAGVSIGLFTLAAHVFHRSPEAWGPFGPPDLPRTLLAVTGACQLIRRELFDLVGGYDEDFVLSYSDIDLCLRVWKLGFRVVYEPASVLVHHEGASRGHTNPSADQRLFARKLRDLGIDHDPYFHPGLDTLSFEPRLAGSGEPRLIAPMQADIDALAGPLGPDSLVDVASQGQVATLLGLEWGRVLERTDIRFVDPSPEAAARLVLLIHRMRPDLRARHPAGLGDDPGGAFATFAREAVRTALGLGDAMAALVDAAFAARLGDRGRFLLVYDGPLREAEPLLLLPNGRRHAIPALAGAVQDGRLSVAGFWWTLAGLDAEPVRWLLATWALTPDWQRAVPDGGTVFGRIELARWVAAEFGVAQDWLFAQTAASCMPPADEVRLAYGTRPAWRAAFPNALRDPAEALALLRALAAGAEVSFLARDWLAAADLAALAAAVPRRGLNVLGHFAYPSGLRVSVESLVTGLGLAGVPTSPRNVPVSSGTDEPDGTALLGPEVHDVTLIHVQPEPLFGVAYPRSGLRPRAARTYRIGFWYWELADTPASWDRAALDCDELWTATGFVADGLRARYRQPVHVWLPGLELPAFAPPSRSALGLDEGAFVFTFTFHMTSVMERKNPLGLIAAFKQAFGGSDEARLVIKTAFGERHPENLRELAEAAAGAPIMIVDEVWSYEKTLGLIQASDAYVSLHRSEGLGLTMAEAMLLGRPVIATGYSGNLEFMDGETALLVEHRLVKLNRESPPYGIGRSWAAPSVRHAAEQMRRLYDDRAFARALGDRGQASARARFSLAASGRRAADRLAEIHGLVDAGLPETFGPIRPA